MTKRLTPIVVQAPQRSEEWYRARLGNVTASVVSKTMEYAKPKAADLAKAMLVYQANDIDPAYVEEMLTFYPVEFCVGVGVDLKESVARATYRQDIVTERITKMRSDTDPYITEDMRWGIMNEITAKTLYHELTGNIIVEAPLMLHPKLYAGASPDGHVTDIETGELGNGEVKCLKSRNHLYKVIEADEVPADYIDQIQFQMFIDGRDWCDFIAFDSRVGEDLSLFIKRVPYDDFYIDNVMYPALIRFLAECDKDERKFYAIARDKKARREARLFYAREKFVISPVITPEEVANFRHPDAQGDDSSL